MQIGSEAHSWLQTHRSCSHLEVLAREFKDGREIEALGLCSQFALLLLGSECIGADPFDVGG